MNEFVGTVLIGVQIKIEYLAKTNDYHGKNV